MENIHDWINSFVLLLIGVAVFIQNGYVSKMKTFIDIFDLEKVKKYVSMQEESMILKATKLVSGNEKVKSMIDRGIEKNKDKIKNDIMEKMGAHNAEQIGYIIRHLMEKNKKERDVIIKGHLPISSSYMIQMCDNIEANDFSQKNKTVG